MPEVFEDDVSFVGAVRDGVVKVDAQSCVTGNSCVAVVCAWSGRVNYSCTLAHHLDAPGGDGIGDAAVDRKARIGIVDCGGIRTFDGRAQDNGRVDLIAAAAGDIDR